MGPRVLGVGLGLFIVLLLWTIALIVCIIFWRSRGPASYAGIGVSAVALLVTIILVIIPKSPETPSTTSEIKVYDNLFIGRIILVILMGIFAVATFGLLILQHWMAPVHAKPLKCVK